MSNPRFHYAKHTHSRKTQNFASICDEIAKDDISYAEWQKRRYSALYDVRKVIEENKKKGVY